MLTLRSLSRSLSLVTALAACDVPGALRDRVRLLTPYDVYAQSLRQAGLDSTALGREWLAASDSAIRSPYAVPLPFTEAGFYTRSEARAVAFRFALTEGQRLEVAVKQDGLQARLFLDLFEQTPDSVPRWDHLTSSRPADSTTTRESRLLYEVRRSGQYVLRLQPELLREGRYAITVRTAPILAFPVEGGSNRSVQSFYGADRDAGRRSHQGIDIFAPRGTPALAAMDGIVRSTSPNELGGNVVWLTDPVRGQTLYYAHLDRHAVSVGESVRQGDTIGFVGNTGNARRTPPHLHFGIYRRGYGAVDPWPWVRRVTAEPAPITSDTARLGTLALIRVRQSILRVAPGTQTDSLRTIARGDTLRIVGAQAAFYRVQLPSGESGYLASQALGASARHRSVVANSAGGGSQ